MNKYVFDSYALLAYAENEKGADEVSKILKESLDKKAEIYLSVINWGEMYYIALREGGQKKADHYLNTFINYPINLIDANKDIALKAAQFKAFNKISYADAFASALANLKDAVLVTGDPEFKLLEKEIKIKWI